MLPGETLKAEGGEEQTAKFLPAAYGVNETVAFSDADLNSPTVVDKTVLTTAAVEPGTTTTTILGVVPLQTSQGNVLDLDNRVNEDSSSLPIGSEDEIYKTVLENTLDMRLQEKRLEVEDGFDDETSSNPSASEDENDLEAQEAVATNGEKFLGDAADRELLSEGDEEDEESDREEQSVGFPAPDCQASGTETTAMRETAAVRAAESVYAVMEKNRRTMPPTDASAGKTKREVLLEQGEDEKRVILEQSLRNEEGAGARVEDAIVEERQRGAVSSENGIERPAQGTPHEVSEAGDIREGAALAASEAHAVARQNGVAERAGGIVNNAMGYMTSLLLLDRKTQEEGSHIVTPAVETQEVPFQARVDVTELSAEPSELLGEMGGGEIHVEGRQPEHGVVDEDLINQELLATEVALDPAYAVNWGIPSSARKGILDDLEDDDEGMSGAGHAEGQIQDKEREENGVDLLLGKKSSRWSRIRDVEHLGESAQMDGGVEAAWKKSFHSYYMDGPSETLKVKTPDDGSAGEPNVAEHGGHPEDMEMLDAAIGIDWSLPASVRGEILENADPSQFQHPAGCSDLFTYMISVCSKDPTVVSKDLPKEFLLGPSEYSAAEGTQDNVVVQARALPAQIDFQAAETISQVGEAPPSSITVHSEEKKVIAQHPDAGGTIVPVDKAVHPRGLPSPLLRIDHENSEGHHNMGGNQGRLETAKAVEGHHSVGGNQGKMETAKAVEGGHSAGGNQGKMETAKIVEGHLVGGDHGNLVTAKTGEGHHNMGGNQGKLETGKVVEGHHSVGGNQGKLETAKVVEGHHSVGGNQGKMETAKTVEGHHGVGGNQGRLETGKTVEGHAIRGTGDAIVKTEVSVSKDCKPESVLMPAVKDRQSRGVSGVGGETKIDHTHEKVSQLPRKVVTVPVLANSSAGATGSPQIKPSGGDALPWSEKKVLEVENDRLKRGLEYERMHQLCQGLEQEVVRGKEEVTRLVHEIEGLKKLSEGKEQALNDKLGRAAKEKEDLERKLSEKDAEFRREKSVMEKREKDLEAMETAKIKALVRKLNSMEARLNEEEDKRMKAEKKGHALSRELAALRDEKKREVGGQEKLRVAEGRIVELEASLNARAVARRASSPSPVAERRVRTVTRRRIMRGGKVVKEELINEPERVLPTEEGDTGEEAAGGGESWATKIRDMETRARDAELASQNMAKTVVETRARADDVERKAEKAADDWREAEARAEALEAALVAAQRKLRSWHRTGLDGHDDHRKIEEGYSSSGDAESDKDVADKSLDDVRRELLAARKEMRRVQKIKHGVDGVAESRGLALLCAEQRAEEASRRVEELEEALRGLKVDLTAVVEGKLKAEVEADQKKEEWEAAVKESEAKSKALQITKQRMRDSEGRVKELEKILQLKVLPPGAKVEEMGDAKLKLGDEERRVETLVAELKESGVALVNLERVAEAAKKEVERLRSAFNLVEEKANSRVREVEDRAEQARKRMADAFDFMMLDQQKRVQKQEAELVELRAEVNQRRMQVKEELEKQRQDHASEVKELMAAVEEGKGHGATVQEMEARMEAAEKRAKDAELRFAQLESAAQAAETEREAIREALERAEQEVEMGRQELEMAMQEVRAAEERIREVEEVREEAERCAEELVEDAEAKAVALQGMEERAERAERKGVILAMALSGVEWKVQEVEKKASADVAALRELRAGLEIKVVALEGALREVEDALRSSLEESAQVRSHAVVLETALVEADHRAQEAKEKALLSMKALNTTRMKLAEAEKRSKVIVEELEEAQRRVLKLGDSSAVAEGGARLDSAEKRVAELQRTLREAEAHATELRIGATVAEKEVDQGMRVLEEAVREAEARAEEREAKVRNDVTAMAERRADAERRAEGLEAALREMQESLKTLSLEATAAKERVDVLEKSLKSCEARAREAERRAEDADTRAEEKSEVARRMAEMVGHSGHVLDGTHAGASSGNGSDTVEERLHHARAEAAMATAESEGWRKKLRDMEQRVMEAEARSKEHESRSLEDTLRESNSLRARIHELEGTVDRAEKARAAAAVEMLVAEAINLQQPSAAGEDKQDSPERITDGEKRMQALTRQRAQLMGQGHLFDDASDMPMPSEDGGKYAGLPSRWSESDGGEGYGSNRNMEDNFKNGVSVRIASPPTTTTTPHKWQTHWPGLPGMERAPASPTTPGFAAPRGSSSPPRMHRSSSTPISPSAAGSSPLRRHALFLGDASIGSHHSQHEEGASDGHHGSAEGRWASGAKGGGGANAGHKAWIEYLLEGQQHREDKMNAASGATKGFSLTAADENVADHRPKAHEESAGRA